MNKIIKRIIVIILIYIVVLSIYAFTLASIETISWTIGQRVGVVIIASTIAIIYTSYAFQHI